MSTITLIHNSFSKSKEEIFHPSLTYIFHVFLGTSFPNKVYDGNP